MKPPVKLTLVLALLGAVAPAASANAAERQARIYGGSAADIADAPFQVALVRRGVPAADVDGQFCGGSIRDETHVITAAHCVFGAGQATDPAALDVLAGTADLADESSPGQRVAVSAVSFEPRYDARTFAYDAAVLTLAEPLDLQTGPARAIARVTPEAWAVTPPGTPLWVSGWGEIDGGGYPTDLREAQMPLRDDASCDAAYGGAIDGAVMVCAGDPLRDSCSGDSGGPLSVDVDGPPREPADLRLSGIVSFGPTPCAEALRPGVYTEVDGPVRPFLEAVAPAPAPRTTSQPAIGGTARVGDALTCSAGAWSGSPAFSYVFARGTVRARGPSADPSYVVQQSDLGAQLRCEVTATTRGGYGVAASGPSAPVEPAPPPPPAPDAEPVAQPAPQAAARPAPLADRVAPVARITRATCSASRCTLDVRVRDAGLSSGVRRLEVRLVSAYRTRCRRGGRSVACTRTRARTLRAARVGAGYRVRATALPRGRHAFTVRAVDVAGNRQAIPARRTVRTSGRR